MKVKHLMESLSRLDPDAQVGVQCISGDDLWIHTDIAIESNGFGGLAEIAIVRTDCVDPNFRAPGAMP